MNCPTRQLLSAVIEGDSETVRHLLQSGMSANGVNRIGDTLLHLVCQAGQNDAEDPVADKLSIIKLLHQHGAQIDARNRRLRSPLHVAVESQQLELVEFLLRAGANPNSRDQSGYAPLHFMAAADADADPARSKAIVQLLLQYGAEIDPEDKSERTPFLRAVINNNLTAVRVLAEAGAKVSHKTKFFPPALFFACERQDVEMTRLLLQHGADPNSREKRRLMTPLHFAAGSWRHCTLEDAPASRSHLVARLLLRSSLGTEVDAADSEGATSLHVAADTKDEMLVRELLRAGARPNISDDYGNTALHELFRSAGHCSTDPRIQRIARLLVTHGADANQLNDDLESGFHLSIWLGNPLTVLDLMAAGADAFSPWSASRSSLSFLHQMLGCNTPETCEDGHEETSFALHVAAALGHLRVVDLLIDAAACPESSNVSPTHDAVKTPLYFAVKVGEYHVAKMLLETGCQVNRYVLHKTTVLHTAVLEKNPAMMYLLLEYGADIHKTDLKDRCSLAYAIECSYDFMDEIMRILLMQYAKRCFSSQDLNFKYEAIISSKSCFANFYRDCVNELNEMKGDILCENVSMLGIISKNLDSLAKCLRNPEVIAAFNEETIKKRYPYYCDMLKIRFNLALERRTLLDSAKDSLNMYLKYENLPEEILWNILDYFNPRELRKLSISNL